MRGVGNTEGGWDKFIVGSLFMILGVYLLLDSVRVVSGGGGMISGFLCWDRHNMMSQTTSMGIIFVPLFTGIVALAYDVQLKWARWLTGFGFFVIVVEMLSRISFFMNMKSSHFLMILALCAVGLGLIFASYRRSVK
jgi:cadmium resistance protein CadD (predicted permease)